MTPNVRYTISNIQTQIVLTGNNSNITSYSSMQDFSILKALKVFVCPPLISVIKEVLWKPLILDWIKGH